MSEWVERINELAQAEMDRDLNTDVRVPGGNEAPRRVAVIRTSDRISFKRCRRKWGFQSHLRHNLGPHQKASPLWFGSGIHFALEDFHGLQQFGTTLTGPSASESFKAYVRATYKQARDTLPDDWKELTELGVHMMDYYQHQWLRYRDPLTTLVVDGIPQVEVNFRIPIPFDPEKLAAWGYDEVVYSGTIDRVAIDEAGGLWLLEYKTAKAIASLHYQTDPQVGAYIWAARHIYPDYHINGVIYQQHRKQAPESPLVKTDGTLSTNKQMVTSHALYRDALIKLYGDIRKAPPLNIGFLNDLAKQEDTDPLRGRDKFIQRDPIYRNEQSGDAEGAQILMEVEDMLNPDLPLYPNPTRDCAYMCSFLDVCVSMNDGSDWESELAQGFQPRETVYDSWRTYLPGGENYS